MAVYKSSFTRAQIEEALNRALNVVIEGKGFALKGEWTSGGSYANAANEIDVVLYDGVSYFCRVTHSGRSTNPKADTTYWGQLAGYEPLIKNAVEDNISDADALIFVDASDNGATKKITWADIREMLPKGDGRDVELRKSETHIQWRYVGEGEWIDIVPLADLKGDAGDNGDPGNDGADGKGIVSIARTSGTGAAGTTDTYTVTYTDSTTTTFQIYNGADGQGAGDMRLSVYDPTGKNTDIFGYVDNKVKTDVPTGAKFTDTVYTHPASHPPSIIAQDASNRFVSDAELSGKADKAAPAASGNLAALDASGNLADSGKKASDFATASHIHSGYAQIKVFSSVAVASAAWSSDATYAAFPYSATITASGVTSDMVPEVNFGLTEAASGNFAPVALSGSGTIKIYAAVAPSAAITIPSITCVKAVS